MEATMKITGKGNRISLNVGGVRCPVLVRKGPWVPQVRPDMVKIIAKHRAFPASFAAALNVENASDSREDYFEPDCVRIYPGHPLYEAALAVA